MNTTSPVIIAGGGISGLATAWFLHERGVPVTVLESRPYAGGSILTSRINGYLVEHGPNSTLQKPGSPEDALGRLIQGIKLGHRLMVANPMAERRYIMRHAHLQLLPTSPPAFLSSPAFSLAAKLRLLLEPFIGRVEKEETIAEFVTRRLGQEFLDYAIEPFISGVYAGNPAELSVRAAVPKIHTLEQEHGSLIRGALKSGKAAKGAGMPRGRMISFDEGMTVLPETIASALPPGTVRTDARVEGIVREEGLWRVQWGSASGDTGEVTAPRLVLAMPAPALAPLLSPLVPLAARILESIPYAPIASVAVGYTQAQVGHPLDGFGFLIPRKERIHTLGALFSSTLFPERAEPGKVLLTAFIGGAMHKNLMEQEDEALVALVRRDLARCLSIKGNPDFLHLTRYARAIPQYTLGHLERIAELDQHLAQLPGLDVRANWRDGISVADCVLQAERLAAKMTQAMV